MRKLFLNLISSAALITGLISCQKNTSDNPTDSTKNISTSEIIKLKADSLLNNVNQEWLQYAQIDSAKYKDLKGVYFQLKNIQTTNLKKLSLLEAETRNLEAKSIDLNTPNFINEFFSYDSLLMLHIKEVIEFSDNTKGSDKLSVLKDLKTSLIAEIDDNKFVSMQSHIDLAVAIYNDYLKSHPELLNGNSKHKILPEFGTIDHANLKPVL